MLKFSNRLHRWGRERSGSVIAKMTSSALRPILCCVDPMNISEIRGFERICAVGGSIIKEI